MGQKQKRQIKAINIDKKRGKKPFSCISCPQSFESESSFYIIEKNEDDPESGDEDCPILPLRMLVCPDCFKRISKEDIKNARVTVPGEKRVPINKRPREEARVKPAKEPPKVIPPSKGGLFA